MKQSILLVDDEPEISGEFRATLEGFGFEIQTASSVEAALHLAAERRFDAILLEFDLRSGRRDRPRTAGGLEIVHNLRAARDTTPILIVTGCDGKWCEAAAFEAGADDFVRKADGVLRLVARLRAHIRKNREKQW